MKKIIPYIDLIRPVNSILVSVYAFLGAYLVVGLNQLISTRVITAAIIVSLVTAFANAYNDYVDFEVDGYGKPDRPIPSGKITRQNAGWFSLGIAVISLIISAFLGMTLFVFTLATIIVSTLYSFCLKGTVLCGNAVTALLIGSIPVYGGLAAGSLNSSVWIAGILLFLFAFAQEVLYDVEDVEGDRKASIITTATFFGEKKALYIYYMLGLTFIISVCVPWFMGWVSNLYFLAAIPFSILPTLAIIIILMRGVNSRSMHQAVYGSWYICFTSLIPLVLMNVGI